MNRYIYGMRLRGASVGTIPTKGIIEIINDPKRIKKYGKGREYHSVLTYCRQLTPKEMEQYELDYLGVE